MKDKQFYQKLIDKYSYDIKSNVRYLAIKIYLLLMDNRNITKEELIDKLLTCDFSLRLLDAGVFYYLVNRMYTDFRKLPKSITPDNIPDFFLYYAHTAPLSAFANLFNHSNTVRHDEYINTHNIYKLMFSDSYIVDGIIMNTSRYTQNSLDSKCLFALGNLLSITIELDSDEEDIITALKTMLDDIKSVNKSYIDFPYTTNILDYVYNKVINTTKVKQLFVLFIKTAYNVKISYNNTFEYIHPFNVYNFFKKILDLLIEMKTINITFNFSENDEILFGIRKIFTYDARKYFPVVIFHHKKLDSTQDRLFVEVNPKDIVCNYSLNIDNFELKKDIEVYEFTKYNRLKSPLLKYIYKFSYDDLKSDFTTGILITTPTNLDTYKHFKKEYKKLFKKYINNNALFSYQYRDIHYLLSRDRAMYFADTGIGKTRVALTTLLLLAKKYNKPTFYILPTGQDTSLAEDIEALDIGNHVKFLYKSNYKYNRKYYKYKYTYDEYLLNLEPGIVYIVKDKDLVKTSYRKIDYDIVFVDEYDKYKNTNGQIANIINDILMNASIFYTMSGTLHPSKLSNTSKYYHPFLFEYFIGHGTSFVSSHIKLYGNGEQFKSTIDKFYTDKFASGPVFNFLMRNKLHPAMKTTIMTHIVRTSKDDPYVNTEYRYKQLNFHYYNLYMTPDEFNVYRTNINNLQRNHSNVNVLQTYTALQKLSKYITLGFSNDFVRNKKLWTLKMLLNNIHAKGEKAIVLFENNDMLELFKKQFSKIYDEDKILIFSSKYNMKKRMDLLLKFRESKDIIAMFATIKTIARSYNLPEANHVIFVEADIISVKNVQAFNRVCRPQQEKEDVNVYFINFKSTLDEYKFNKIADLIKNNASFDFSNANYINRISDVSSISVLLRHLEDKLDEYETNYDNYELKTISFG